MPRFNLDDYVSVQDRINQFWQDHSTGRIITRLMSDPTDFSICRYMAEVYRDADDARPAATGCAFEIAGGNSANQTAHEENCETSAIGRALANLGYATSQRDRPSREEMGKADRGEQRPPARPPQQGNQRQAEPNVDIAKALRAHATKCGIPAITLETESKRRFKRGVHQLDREQARELWRWCDDWAQTVTPAEPQAQMFDAEADADLIHEEVEA